MKLKTPVLIRNRSHRAGQSLCEYGLALGLVAVVAIGGLILLGDQLGLKLGSIRTTLSGENNTGTAVSPSTVQVLGRTATSSGVNASLADVCYGESGCLDLGKIPAMSGTIQAGGSNGVEFVRNHSSVLEQIAALVAKDAEVDPSFKEIATKLALAGHDIANEQARSMQEWVNFQKENPDFSGRYTTAIKPVSQDFESLKTQASAYLAAHPNVLPPDMAGVLMTSANSISTEATAFLRHPPGKDDIQDTGVELYDNVTYSTAEPDHPMTFQNFVHEKSNTVCTSGGDEGKCIQ